MKYIFSVVFLFTSLLSLYSCTSSNNQSTSISAEDSVTIERFDKDLYSFLEGTSTDKENELKDKYKEFLSAFGSVTIDNSDYNSPLFFPSLITYFSNNALSQIYTKSIETFSNVEPYQQQLTDANILIISKLPGKKLPKLCMHVSGFKSNTIVIQDLISISIDKYLGKDYPLYKEFFEEYQRNQMQPQMIVRDYLRAWLITELATDNKRKNLLSQMIDEGKVLYTLQQLLPNWTEADIIGYTPEQIEWADKNRKNIWKTTVKKNYLYSSDYMTIVKYMDDAPYTSLVASKSPGRLGAWIGWQIVKEYADNSGDSLQNILNDTDYQKILKSSRFNP